MSEMSFLNSLAKICGLYYKHCYDSKLMTPEITNAVAYTIKLDYNCN
jgi:hypothetical protein